MTKVRSSRLAAGLAAAGVALAVVATITTVSALGAGDDGTARSAPVAVVAAGSADPVGADIARQQSELERNPANHDAWAALGLGYVEQARITVDPAFYPKAEGALEKSLELNTEDNYLAMAGMAALTAAQHEFADSRTWALRGLEINPASALLQGALSDAATQLGRYREAERAATRMNELQPGVSAFARVAYALELRGDVDGATAAMRAVLRDADKPSDVAFARGILGELALDQGDAKAALVETRAGLAVAPQNPPLTQVRARALAALGREDAAVATYQRVVDAVAQPDYLLEFGEYLESIGRASEAAAQYELFTAVNDLYVTNGAKLDTDATLFYANRGDGERAVEFGRAGVRSRPFVEMFDAYAWALYANGDYAEAKEWSTKARSLGTKNALFEFHAGMIDEALGNEAAARRHLRAALDIDPTFSPLGAPMARATLKDLR